jgi:hypothetical protein
MTEALGVTSFWGFSPSMDLLQATIQNRASSSSSTSAPINVLLINPADIRHIMHTVAQHYDDPDININVI